MQLGWGGLGWGELDWRQERLQRRQRFLDQENSLGLCLLQLGHCLAAQLVEQRDRDEGLAFDLGAHVAQGVRCATQSAQLLAQGREIEGPLEGAGQWFGRGDGDPACRLCGQPPGECEGRSGNGPHGHVDRLGAQGHVGCGVGAHQTVDVWVV